MHKVPDTADSAIGFGLPANASGKKLAKILQSQGVTEQSAREAQEQQRAERLESVARYLDSGAKPALTGADLASEALPANLESVDKPRFTKRRKAKRKGKLEPKIYRHLRSLGIDNPEALGLSIITPQQWRELAAALWDRTGKALRALAARIFATNPYGLGLLREAALVTEANGRTRYSWADFRARAIGVLACLQQQQARTLDGHVVCISIPVSAMLALLKDPISGKTPHRNTLVGTHRAGSTYRDGQVGYLVALREVGFFEAYQARYSSALPCEKLGGEHTTNRYYLATTIGVHQLDPSEQQRAWELVSIAVDVFPYESNLSLGRHASLSPYSPHRPPLVEQPTPPS